MNHLADRPSTLQRDRSSPDVRTEKSEESSVHLIRRRALEFLTAMDTD